jgi:hypothetical protein
MKKRKPADTCDVHELPAQGCEGSTCIHCPRPFPSDARPVSYETAEEWKRLAPAPAPSRFTP